MDGFPSSVWNVDSFKVVFPIRKEHLEAKPLPQFKLNEIKRADKLARKQQKLKEAKNKPKSRLVVVNPDTETSDSEYEAAKKMVDMKIKNYKAGYRNFPDFEDDDEQTKKARTAFEELALFRPSLDPPPKPSISAAEYKLKNEPMHLGRPLMIESNEHEFSGRLWMYEPTGDPLVDLETVPFKVETLYPMLSLMGINNEHLRSLDNFMSQTLPNGFPVQIEIPIGILPLSCMINFKNITRSCDKGDDWFKLPSGYRAGEVISASAGQ